MMTYATRSLINELSQIVDTNKYLLLSGCTGVGKTYLATEIVNNCLKAEYNSQGKLSAGKDLYDCELEFVPIHPSFSSIEFRKSGRRIIYKIKYSKKCTY